MALGAFFKVDFMGLTNYIKETKTELKHVSWPSRRQTMASTAIVIIGSVALSLFLAFFDVIAGWALKLFLN